MLCEYAHAELAQPENQGRAVVSNQDWIALVPWWATWPFEILREFSFIQATIKYQIAASPSLSPAH
jgi:UDPglucose--hexose-1-phosphate uridylyltransferase